MGASVKAGSRARPGPQEGHDPARHDPFVSGLLERLEGGRGPGLADPVDAILQQGPQVGDAELWVGEGSKRS